MASWPTCRSEFSSTNGILQGCPLSALLLNLIVRVWCTAIETHCPEVLPRAYADDGNLISSSTEHLRVALNWTQRFSEDTGQSLHAKKTKGWSTTPDGRKRLNRLTIKGHPLKTVLHDRVLGIQQAFSRRRCPSRLDKQQVPCGRVCQRIQCLGLPLEVRACLVGALVINRGLFGCVSDRPSQGSLVALRRKCTTTIWGRGRQERAPEILYTLLCQGHRADPLQACAFNTLVNCRRLLARRPELLPLFSATWHLRQVPGRQIEHGPVRAIALALRDAGWLMSSPTDIILDYETQETLPLLHENNGLIEHRFREALRVKQLRTLARRRPDFAGVEEGIDRTTTMRACSRARGLWKMRYRQMLAGALTTRTREHRKKRCSSAACQCCDLQIPETEPHILWDCPHPLYGLIRESLRCPLGTLHDLPPCLRLHGILPAQHGFERPEFVVSDLQAVLVCLAAARDHMQPEEDLSEVGDFARRVRQRRV